MSKSNRRVKEGVVVSDKMAKTVVVSVDRHFKHPFYHKVIRRSKKFKAHDGDDQAKVGDLVKIMETRPISKDKRWVVVEVVKKEK
jgi:small subunit ribosomal protein S17